MTAAAPVAARQAGILRSVAELESCRATWDRLAAGAGNPVAHFAYRRAWAEGLTDAQELSVFAVEDGIAPLVANRGGAGWLTLLAAEMYEILDFLYADEAAAGALARAIAATGRPLFLKRVPAGSPAIAAVRESYAVALRREGGGAPWIPLDASWAEPEAHLNSGRRSDLRRARRAAEKLGPLECEIVAPEPAQVAALVEEAFRVEAAGWKGAQASALAGDPVRGAFFRRYAEDACRRGTLRMGFLRIGGRAAAAQIAVDDGDCFSLLRAGYDEAYARCSPGALLTAESIRYAAGRKLRAYEFNGTVEPWTAVWTHEAHPCCSIRAFPFRPRALAALAAGGWRAAAGRIRGLG